MLKDHCSSLINNRIVRQGIYQMNDLPDDFVDMCIKKGIAIVIEENAPEPVTETPDEDIDYDSMTKLELTEILGDDLYKIDGTGANGNVLKSDIIAWLQDNE